MCRYRHTYTRYFAFCMKDCRPRTDMADGKQREASRGGGHDAAPGLQQQQCRRTDRQILGADYRAARNDNHGRIKKERRDRLGPLVIAGRECLRSTRKHRQTTPRAGSGSGSARRLRSLRSFRQLSNAVKHGDDEGAFWELRRAISI